MLACAALAKPKPTVPVFRWAPHTPGCTFTKATDGKYVYGLTTPETEFTVSVDEQELQKIHRRIEPFFSLHVDVHYHGSSTFDMGPELASLEFVNHHRVIQPSLDADSFALRTQEDVEEVEFEMEREIKKHPERREERERYLQTYKKEVTDMQDFLSRHTLSGTTLDPANPQISGWILFSTRSKWLGDWKSRESFILRFTWKKQVIEFPFALPPTQPAVASRPLSSGYPAARPVRAVPRC